MDEDITNANELKISGKSVLRKKSLGRKIRESLFSGDSITDVIGYLATDVAMPSIKDMLFDLVDKGLEKWLYGDEAPRHTNVSSRNSSYVSYGSMARRSTDKSPSTTRRVKPNTCFEDDLFLPNIPAGTEGYPDGANGKENAIIIKDIMIERISKYNHATIAELFSEVKELYPDMTIEGHGWTDGYYGWTNFSTARIMVSRDGATLELPKCEQLD